MNSQFFEPFGLGMLIGIGLQPVIAWLRCRWADKYRPLPGGAKHRLPLWMFSPRLLALLLAVGMLSWSLYQTNENRRVADQLAREAKQFALEVQECQKQFNEALQARAKITVENQNITSENDDLSKAQRWLVFLWMYGLIFPPEPYASMPTSDPRRQEYGIARTDDTVEQFRASLDRQEELDRRQSELDRQREQHPLPDPTCGR